MADGFMREFSTRLTWIEVGMLSGMGLIADMAVGQLAGLRRGGRTVAR
jgi:hypothetical protein